MENVIIDTAPLVLDVGIVLLLAATLGLLVSKLRLPSILGYLLAGLVVSPFTPGFVADRNQLSLLADIGVVLLLFEVGIEIDLRSLRKSQRNLFLGVPLQVVLGLSIGTIVFQWVGVPLLGSLLLALSVAMSSSVVIVNIVKNKQGSVAKDTESALLGWSVIQDVLGVVIAAIVLALFGAGEKSAWLSILQLVGFAAVAYSISKLLPYILKNVHKEPELFLIYSVSCGLVTAAIGNVVFDVPMALAGFIAGLSINQNQDTDDVRKVILPFRDLFVVLFFVVIGSMIQPSQLKESWSFAVLILGMLLILKTIPNFLFSKYRRITRQPITFAIGTSQIGEFSFVLGSIAFAHNVLSASQYMGILVAVVVSIAGSSFLTSRISQSEMRDL